MLYKFKDIKDATFQEGYVTLIINGGQAQVDENDPAQVALAEKKGGQPVAEKKTAEPDKKSKKESS